MQARFIQGWELGQEEECIAPGRQKMEGKKLFGMSSAEKLVQPYPQI